MSELKPCPCCNGISWVDYRAFTTYVYCDKCGLRTKAYNTEAEAIEAWNTRHERTCSPVEPFDSKTKHIVERGSNHYYWPYRGCPECQCDFPQDSNFCPNCGARVKEDE